MDNTRLKGCKMKKKKPIPKQKTQDSNLKDFIDLISPAAIKFNTDHFILGDTYRSVWAIREYPPRTSSQAILSDLGDRENVTLHIYSRFVDSVEQNKILQNAARKNKLMSGSENVQESINAEGNMEDVVSLLSETRKNREPLLHCAVFIELRADSREKLSELQTEISMALARETITVDRLTLRQLDGFRAVSSCGYNAFTSQFERVLPASSVANLYPFSYSGKTDPHGYYIGRDKYGSNIIVDFDRRADDKTNANVLILGNSGQGKSYLMKLLLTNLRELGKSIISLDAEQEYEDLANNLGGCYIDLMSGRYIINPLEPKAWSEDSDYDSDDPEAFRKSTRLSQHISYLKDFFRAYKDFSDAHIDAIEILLARLYEKFGITDATDYSKLKPSDYPIMSDLYELVESEYKKY